MSADVAERLAVLRESAIQMTRSLRREDPERAPVLFAWLEEWLSAEDELQNLLRRMP